MKTLTVDEAIALMTNRPGDPFRVAIIAKVKAVRGWSCVTREAAEATAQAYLTAHPEWSHATINGERFERVQP